MIGASKRKKRLPRKILRVQQDDGRWKLEPQENCEKSDEHLEYDDIPSPSSSPPQPSAQYESFYNKYDHGRDYRPAYVGGEYLKEATKLFLKSQTKSDYVVVQPSLETTQTTLSDTENKAVTTPNEDRVKTYNPVKKYCHQTSKQNLPNMTRKHHHPEPTPDNPYQCETCDMLFKDLELLTDHQRSVHENNRQFACRYCGKRFNDKYNMRKHVLIHVGEKRHKCQFCDKAFLRKDHLRSHLQTHYNRKYGCKVCGKSFKTIELYQRHAKTHKGSSHLTEINNLENLHPELEKCASSINGNSPPSVNGGYVKREGHRFDDCHGEDAWNRSGSPTFSDISGSSLSHASPRGMDYGSSNEASENKKMSYKCSFCNTSFEDREDLSSHEMKCRAETQKWQCVKCNIIFDEPATLKQHYEKIHSPEKPTQSPSSRWRCKTCDINYPNSKELSRHYASAHKDAQIFPCSECPKTFTVWHNLKKHMLIHLGDKKHKCNVCDKGFVRKDHLNSHMKVHMGDGSKFTCPICGKVFRLKQMYFKHMNLHGLEQAHQIGI